MRNALISLFLVSLLFAPRLEAIAQDRVTIPKSRLEELERKEAELERLKKEAKTPAAPIPSQPVAGAAAAPAPAVLAPAPRPVTPMASLPPLQPGEKVSSVDLVGHFLADPVGADQRYRRQTVVVEGKVIRFAKQLMRRDYDLILEGPQAGQEVVCRMRMPDHLDAIYLANSGSELVGTTRTTKTVLARIGATTIVRGSCKGLKGAQVIVAGELPGNR